MDTVHLGTAGLAGWRKKAADVVAPQVAARTPLDEEQVRSLVGAAFFVLAAMYVVRTARTALAEARRSEPAGDRVRWPRRGAAWYVSPGPGRGRGGK